MLPDWRKSKPANEFGAVALNKQTASRYGSQVEDTEELTEAERHEVAALIEQLQPLTPAERVALVGYLETLERQRVARGARARLRVIDGGRPKTSTAAKANCRDTS